MEQDKRPRGRPTDNEKTERIQARATPEQKETYIALGGNEWLSKQLDKAAKQLSKGKK